MVEERSRRLPNWMLGVTANAADDHGNSADNKKKEKKRLTDPEEDGKPNSIKNSKSEAKRRKHKQIQQATDDVPNSKTNNRPRVGRKRKAKRDEENKAEEYDDDNEEEELTVEDLVSIAEEYVKAEEDTLRKLTSSKNDNLEESVKCVPNDDHMSATACYSSTASSGSEQSSLFLASSTGDPAYDMLDLFLGPLLKKPMEMEKGNEFVTMDVGFAFELKRKSQNVGEEIVPVAWMEREKKKSSLKDKVSCYLTK